LKLRDLRGDQAQKMSLSPSGREGSDNAPSNTGTGTLIVSNVNVSLPFALGDKFSVFNQPVSNGGALTISPPPGSGLAWQNNLAVDGSIAVVTALAINRTNITLTVSGSNLQLSWPQDHTGWLLECQTNGLGTNWFVWPGSDATNAVSVPISLANQSAFFRLVYP
jgi:hypothetical protein